MIPASKRAKKRTYRFVFWCSRGRWAPLLLSSAVGGATLVGGAVGGAARTSVPELEPMATLAAPPEPVELANLDPGSLEHAGHRYLRHQLEAAIRNINLPFDHSSVYFYENRVFYSLAGIAMWATPVNGRRFVVDELDDAKVLRLPGVTVVEEASRHLLFLKVDGSLAAVEAVEGVVQRGLVGEEYDEAIERYRKYLGGLGGRAVR